MTKLGKLKLNHLSENALDERQLSALKGGCGCGCGGCACVSWDGSGTMPVDRNGNDLGMGSSSESNAAIRSYWL